MSDETLPPGWATTKIKDLITPDGVFVDGDWIESKDQDPDGDVRLIQLADVGEGAFLDKSARFLTSSKAEELRCTFLKKGDVLIARMPDPMGRACIFPLEGENRFVTVVDVCIIRTSAEIASPEFLTSAINFLGTRKQIEDLQTGTTRKRISRGNLANVTIPLPPLPEQKRIVAKIEELFSELEAGEASLRKARRQLGVYRQSLLKQAFEGKLTAKWRTQNPDKLESPASLLARIQSTRQAYYEEQLKDWEAEVKAWESAGQKGKRPAKPTEPASFASKEFEGLEVPLRWAVEQIGNCPIDALIGLVRSADVQHAEPTGFRYIKMDRVDMQGNTNLDADVFVDCTPDEVARFSLRKGDILFNTRNSVELVGKVGIVRRDPETPTVYNNNLMRLRLPDCLDPLFVGLQLCAQPFRQRMEKVKKATTSVAAVYGKDFWPLPVVLCSLPEQQEIVRLLDEQFEAIERNERELDAALKRSEALRQSILKKAFSGRLVPQDPSDPPASALLARLRVEQQSATTPANRRGRKTSAVL